MLSYGPCGALVHIVNLMIAGYKDMHIVVLPQAVSEIGLPMVWNAAKNDHFFVRYLQLTLWSK
jgi:hypothetical protein